MANHTKLHDDAKRIMHVYKWVTERGNAELLCTAELVSEGPIKKTARICGVSGSQFRESLQAARIRTAANPAPRKSKPVE